MISKQAVLEIIEKDKNISMFDRTNLYRKISELPSISDGWINIEDRQPENGSTIEFWDLDYNHPVTFQNYQINDCYELAFRHWKPLSTAPTK